MIGASCRIIWFMSVAESQMGAVSKMKATLFHFLLQISMSVCVQTPPTHTHTLTQHTHRTPFSCLNLMTTPATKRNKILIRQKSGWTHCP